MILLTAQDLTRQFDVAPVLRGVSFDVRPGERIGLVGPNGCGKTTLLKILAGLDEPDVGRVERHPTADVALLEQETAFDDETTLLDVAKAGLAHLYELQRESHELADRIAAERDAASLERLHRRFDFVQHELHRHDAYHIDHRVDEVLHGLGFDPTDYGRPLRTFSGGQQNRALLARLLLRDPDVMLLDEPTNHLDIAATEWLEGWLNRLQNAVVLVSHDRYFLDRVTNRILELYEGRATDYSGNFSAYWSQRDERLKVLQRTFEKQQEFIEKTEDFIRRNRYGQKHAQAADREKKLERLEAIEVPHEIPTPPMRFGKATRTADVVIEARDVARGFGSPLFERLDVAVRRGDRLGILGPNGSGKTTLLRVLIGELSPDAGTVRLGAGVKLGYYDQQLSSVDPTVDAVQAARPPDPTVTPGAVRNLLAAFGVRGELALQTVGTMSGGEKGKVALARLSALNANVLVLDEPTNHLDLWARAGLESALREFEGTLLFVSHDRYFLDRVATSVLVLGGERWRYFEGNYSAFVEFEKARLAEESETAGLDGRPDEPTSADRRRNKDREPRRKRKFAYRHAEDIEAEIHEKEGALEQKQADLADPETYRTGGGDAVRTLMQDIEELETAIAKLYAHWEEATELN